jgi:hypothetical protein
VRVSGAHAANKLWQGHQTDAGTLLREAVLAWFEGSLKDDFLRANGTQRLIWSAPARTTDQEAGCDPTLRERRGWQVSAAILHRGVGGLRPGGARARAIDVVDMDLLATRTEGRMLAAGCMS